MHFMMTVAFENNVCFHCRYESVVTFETLFWCRTVKILICDFFIWFNFLNVLACCMCDCTWLCESLWEIVLFMWLFIWIKIHLLKLIYVCLWFSSHFSGSPVAYIEFHITIKSLDSHEYLKTLFLTNLQNSIHILKW